MTDKEKILAKIQSLLNETNYEPFTDEVLGKIYACKSLLSFINTLEVQSSWHDAQGADLPELDREVIALLTNGKVVFAHRPKESWTGKNIDTGELTTYYPERYDKGGWNQPDVKYWLDCELPNDAKYWFDYELPYMED